MPNYLVTQYTTVHGQTVKMLIESLDGKIFYRAPIVRLANHMPSPCPLPAKLSIYPTVVGLFSWMRDYFDALPGSPYRHATTVNVGECRVTYATYEGAMQHPLYPEHEESNNA